MRYEHCEAEFEAKTMRRRFCSGKCRAVAWQQKRGNALAVAEEQLTRALAQIRECRQVRVRERARSPE